MTWRPDMTEDGNVVDAQEPQLQLRKALVKARSRLWVDAEPILQCPCPGSPSAAIRPRGSPAASFELILKRPRGQRGDRSLSDAIGSDCSRKAMPPPLPAPQLAGPPARSVRRAHRCAASLLVRYARLNRAGRWIYGQSHRSRYEAGRDGAEVLTAL